MGSRVALLLLLLALVSTPALAQEDDPNWKGRPLSSWVRDLAHKDESKRYDALTAIYYLAQQGKAEAAVTPLIQTLGDASPWCRELAALTLGKIGNSSLPPLILTLNAQELKLRLAATRALEHMQPGSLSAPAIAALEESLRNDPDPNVRSQAAIALGRTRSAAAQEALVRRLRSKKEADPVRAAAAFALGEMGLPTKSALTALKFAKTHDAARVAAFRLWNVGRTKLTPDGKAAYRKSLQAMAEPRARAWYRARRARSLKTTRRRRKLLGFFSRRARVAMNLKDLKAEDAALEKLAQANPAKLLDLSWERLRVDEAVIASTTFEDAGFAVIKARLKQAAHAWEETSRWAWVDGDWVLASFADKRPDPLEPKRVKTHSRGVDSAIEHALKWLARHQSRDGRWDNDGWGDTCKAKCGHDGARASRFDVGLTGLALLAFLGDGHTPSHGKHAAVVRSGLAWLKRQQKADGSIGYQYDQGESVYNHHFATFALAEAMRMTQDSALNRYVEKAVEYTVKSANPGLGWKYGPRTGKNDTSVTGIATLSLLTARNAGFKVPAQTFDGAQKWLIRATDSSGSVGYETPGGGSSLFSSQRGMFDQQETMTALSVTVRLLLGERPVRSDAMRRGLTKVRDHPPKWAKKTMNFYHWHVGTRALRLKGGRAWKEWDKNLQMALLPKQVMKACGDGSWPPTGQWAVVGGRVYATAINALSLEGTRPEQPWLEP